MERDHERGLVWVVEDSPLEAEMARRALAPTQDVEIIADGALVLERIDEGTIPDAIVLDWQLPTVTGVEVCRVIRASHDANALPILMLTVQGRKQDVAFAFEAGANDYVTKPYDVPELVARVQTLVRTSHLQRAQLRRARQLELAANIGAALTRARGVDALGQACASILARHLDATFAGIWFEGAGRLVLAAAAGSEADRAPPSVLASKAAETQTIVASGRVAAVPLLLGDDLVGVMAASSSRAIEETKTSLATVADLVALGIARARAESARTSLLESEKAAREDAEQANRAKDEFLAVVSHELRTPLNAITGWAGMLTSGVLDPVRTKRALETIERNARAQAQLIEDLLDVTRITSGKLRLEIRRIDVTGVADLALESVRFAAEAKGVIVTSMVEPGVPAIVGDPDRVQQIIWNLLSNAIKFTPSGGRVCLTMVKKAGEVEISVEDTGKGITADFLPHVFERFRQADGSATRTSGGLGLGLAIVRHLVELHGGTIAAMSEGLGKGATFTVRLPSVVESRPGDGPPVNGAALRQKYGNRPELQGLHVLVVDDEADAREMVRTILETCGLTVTTASSAAEAYEQLGRQQPAVIVSDVAMPGEDGLSFIRRVRALDASAGGRIPAIALTAYARVEDRENALDAGFTSHVAKPLNASELFAVLSSLAARRAD